MAAVGFSCVCGLDVSVRGIADVAACDLTNRLVEQHKACVVWALTPDEEPATSDAGGRTG